MEPQQARLTFVAFMALASIIVFNALFLQKDAGFSLRANTENASFDLRAGGLAGSVSDSRNDRGSKLHAAIRRELSQRNYFPGSSISRLDGRLDAMTMGAIMAYQHDSGLPVTGLATDSLLKSFLFGIDKAARLSPKASEPGADTRQLVAEIQGILSAKGHYSGKINGLFDARTLQAVKRFERHAGLPVSGRISGLLVQELTRLTGVAFSASQK